MNFLSSDSRGSSKAVNSLCRCEFQIFGSYFLQWSKKITVYNLKLEWIMLLFLPMAQFWIIQGVVSEFRVPKAEDPSLEQYQFHWLYTNGLLGIIFTFGLHYTALKSRKARSWLYGTGLSMEQRFILFCNYLREWPSQRFLNFFTVSPRLAKEFHCRLRSTSNGSSMDCTII